MAPSGLHIPDASLARNFVGATPTEHVIPCASSTCALISPAICAGLDRIRFRAPLTSRNASSRLNGSTSGVMSRKIDITPRETSW